MTEFLQSCFKESTQEKIPEKIHDLFVEISMNEDLENFNPEPPDNKTKSSTDSESSFDNTAAVHNASTSATTVADETTTTAVVPDVIFAETTSTGVVPDVVFAETTSAGVVPDVVAATPVVIPAAAAPTTATTTIPPIAATTATKTIFLSSDTILFSTDDEDPQEDEEEFNFQAIHNTTTSFMSKLFNTWNETKIRSKAFRIKSAKQIKKFFELSTEENCERLGFGDYLDDVPTQPTTKPVASLTQNDKTSPTQPFTKPVAPLFTQNDKTYSTQPTIKPVAPIFTQNETKYSPLNTLSVPTDSLSRALLNSLRCDHIMNGTELSPLVQYISCGFHFPCDASFPIGKHTANFAPVTPERPTTPSILDQAEDYDDMESISDYKPTANFVPFNSHRHIFNYEDMDSILSCKPTPNFVPSTFPRQNFNQEEYNHDFQAIMDFYSQNLEDSRNLYNEDWEV
ncbi:uncharacterized protein J8A68_002785 [[Candida] subhashii]|uniref:Uncharacterized protein n=1 Tax=[Candida] subhashii TaxID=561895 RepID=A0A8J5QKJ9_9ASCO|nr:uncharacterized protein J8A68_002785 [[Candida] subhashii]KAG7663699.1 hypothetical protein J8A68_002785 [[Candida] subhashii]